jgi:hypothetical protein
MTKHAMRVVETMSVGRKNSRTRGLAEGAVPYDRGSGWDVTAVKAMSLVPA